MKPFKRVVALLLAICCAGALSACGGSSSTANSSQTAAPSSGTPASGDAKYVFKAGHVLSSEHPYQKGLEKMNELLNERTNGQISLDIYPSSQLGAERELIESVQMNTVDIALVTSPLANFDTSWYLFDIPSIFYTKQHAYDFLDGEYGQAMLEGLSKVNIKGMAFWETGFFNIFDNQRAIETPQDLDGMTFRVMENDAYITYFSTLGSNPVPMAYSEVFTALQNGTVNGTLIPIASIYTSQFYTVAPYITRSQNWYCPVTFIMSQDSWNSMPEDLQQTFQECCNDARDYMRQMLTDSEEEQVQKMKDEGSIITEVDKAKWREQEADAVEAVKKLLVPAKVPQETLDVIAELGKKYQ